MSLGNREEELLLFYVNEKKPATVYTGPSERFHSTTTSSTSSQPVGGDEG